jgi:NAD+ diphosphatase
LLNEISPGIFDNRYFYDHEIADEDFLLCYRDNQVLLKKSGDDYEIPVIRDFIENIESPVYLFSINSIPCFGLVEVPGYQTSCEFHDIFDLRNLKNKTFAWIGSVGYQLMTWYNNNRYCGRCGSKTELKKEERAIICPVCNLHVFPKISPAIIVAITCNNEVKEEVGLDVKNIKYYKSQPWPFSASLMLGFTAEGYDNQQIIIDEKEIGQAGWFERGNLPDHASAVSISGDLIEAFEKGIF